MRQRVILGSGITILIVFVGASLYYISHFDNTSSASVNAKHLTNNHVQEKRKDTIPTCKHAPLIQMTPIVIDNVVKNCTIKSKTGSLPEGLGGGAPEYQLYNGYLMDDQGGEAACIDSYGTSKRGKSGDSFVVSTGDSLPEGFKAIEMIANKGYLYSIASDVGGVSDICNKTFNNATQSYDIDQDCANMHDQEGRNNGTDYFVAGYRDLSGEKLLYIINDNLYDPGIGVFSEKNNTNYLTDSARQFAGITNKKIIVKRVKNGKAQNKNNEDGTLPLNFVLETCEIAIK